MHQRCSAQLKFWFDFIFYAGLPILRTDIYKRILIMPGNHPITVRAINQVENPGHPLYGVTLQLLHPYSFEINKWKE